MRTAVGQRLHRAAGREPAAPGCTGASPACAPGLPALRMRTGSPVRRRRGRARPTRCAGIRSRSGRAAGFHRRPAHHRRQRHADAQTGVAVHLVLANRSMDRVLVNADGEMLLVPQQGTLTLTTELGVLQVAPGEIALLPRGLAFRSRSRGRAASMSAKTTARRSACLNSAHRLKRAGACTRLPGAGAAFEATRSRPRCEEIRRLPVALRGAVSPFNVVAWHGNLVPCKYIRRAS